MYDKGISTVNEDDFIISIDFSKKVEQLDRSKKFYFRESGEPIEFSMPLAHLVRKYVIEAFQSHNPLAYDPPVSGDPRLDGEIKRFIVALYAYMDPRSEPVLSFSFLVDGLLDKEFASYLKKIRFVSMVRSINGNFCETDLELEKIPVYDIHDIGQIFNFHYWFFWSEEDPHDEMVAFDYPMEPMHPDVIEEYKTALASVLPAEVEEVSPDEILLASSSSSAESMFTEGQSSPVYIEKQVQRFNVFSTDPLKAKIVYVQKCAGDTRGASVLTIAQSNTVKLVEKQTALVASKTKHSAYISNKTEFDRKYRSYARKFTKHLCRDFKKDGLTKNRQLVQLTFDVLIQKYPDIGAFRTYKQVYSDWTFFYGDNPKKIFHPDRGIGLGMTSALTTLMGCGAIQMTLNRLQSRGDLYFTGGEGLVYHDDTAVGFYDIESLQSYDEVEDDVMLDTRQIKNRKKSFYGDEFVLCERYSGSLNRKMSYQLNLLYSPYHACNITHAKDMLQQLVRFETDLDVLQFVQGYETYWGYEFHTGETKKPYRLGGWLPAVYLGVDTTFMWYDHTKEDFSCLNSCSVHKLEKPLKKSVLNFKEIYHGPLEHQYGPNLDVGDYGDLYSYRQPWCNVARMFTGFRASGSFALAYDLLYKKRQSSYSEALSVPLLKTESEVYKMFCEFYPYIDFLPKDDYCPSYDIEDFKSEDELPPLFGTVNRYLGYLAFLNPKHEKLQHVLPYPLPPVVNVSEKSLTATEREFSRRVVVGIGGTYSSMPLTIYHLPGKYNFISTGWLHPEQVVQAYKAYNLLPRIPVRPFIIKEADQVNNYRGSTLNFWLDASPYRYLFLNLVKKLGFRFMCKPELMCDEFYTEHIIAALEELRRPLNGIGPYKVPLPIPDEEEEFFFHEDLMHGILSYITGSYDQVENYLSASDGSEDGEGEEGDPSFWDNFVPVELHDSYSEGSADIPPYSHALSSDGSKYTRSSDESQSDSYEDPFEHMTGAPQEHLSSDEE